MDLHRWQRVQELFEAALQRDGAARLEFLTESCGDDSDLLEEVTSLIRADEKGGALLDSPLPAAAFSEEPRLRPGDSFRHYRILGRLGTGGMGIVYKAVDTRLERAVALKFLSERLIADRKAKERFLLEARAASKLDHPNICTIYEIGSPGDDAIFISMAFCEGQTVEALIEAGPLPADQAMGIAVQVADGLRQAHAQGIVHRDIKPANVIVTPECTAKIVDFGIAKLPGIRLTDKDAQIGTVAYMSPEQFRGEAIDHRSDLWSLGVLFYEALTGRHPFPGDDPATILHAVLHSDPTPPSYWQPGSPQALDRIVARALARDPDRRYQTAGAFLADIDALRDPLSAEGARHRRPADAERATGQEAPGPNALTQPGERAPGSGYGERPDASAGGELRQVTVLFIELDGLGSRLEPEDRHHVLERYFDAVDQIVERYGGMVDKQIGDSVMAVFGAPLAHDDDCERALRVASDIRRRMSELREEFGLGLRVRIGIANGQEMAGGFGRGRDSAYTITGETVNEAARLAKSADPGETLISDAVFRNAAGLLDVEAWQSPQPTEDQTPVWRLVGLRGTPASGAGAFVGRRAELRQLAAISEDCRESRRGEVILLRGQAGIGKTRLLAEFRTLAERDGFRCHTGLVLDFGVAEGQDAIGILARSFLGVSSDGTVVERRHAAQTAFAEGCVTAEQQVFLNDLLSLPQPPALHAIYDAMDNATRNRGKQQTMAALLEGAAARGPVLVAVEDIHWADALTLEYLAAMASAVAACPALLVITSRIEGDPLGPSWQGAVQDTPLIAITLAPLRNEEAESLAIEFMDTTSPLARRCIERAEGNPLFLEQLLRNARDTPEEDTPSSIQSLVLARLDRLPDIDRAALRAASVVGQRFSIDALRHLLDQPDYDCSGLLQHYLIRPDGPSYLFAHALIQDCVYASLLKTRKREQHLRAAEWFASRDAALRAEHLDRAEDRMAPQAYLEAAREQMTVFRYDQALRLVERGLAIVRDAPERHALSCLQGELLRELGSVAASLDAFEAALEVAEDDTSRCRAWLGLAEGMRLSDDYDRAFEALDRAQSLAARHRLAPELAQLHYLRGSLCFPLGRIEACREQHEAALENARRAGSAEREALALSGLGDAAYARGRMHSALAHFRDCLELCGRHGLGRIEAANRFMIGTIRIYLNELDGALEDSLASAELAARVGHKRAEIVSRLTAGWVLIDQDRFDGARAQAESGLAIAHSLGAKRFKPFLNESLARIRLAEGDRAGALELLDSALGDVREGGATSFIGPWLLGTIALATDDPERRRAALAEGEEILAGGCVGHNHYRFYQAAMEATLEAHDWDEAERYAAALEAFTRPEPVPWADFYIRRARALALVEQGRGGAAATRELTALREEARTIGLLSATSLVERVLARNAGKTPPRTGGKQ
ncbi:MAG: protein kinase [Kiloniellales bacterium]|nr:protein kinase [Kiloniellales bacterium]